AGPLDAPCEETVAAQLLHGARSGLGQRYEAAGTESDAAVQVGAGAVGAPPVARALADQHDADPRGRNESLLVSAIVQPPPDAFHAGAARLLVGPKPLCQPPDAALCRHVRQRPPVAGGAAARPG